MEIYLQLAERRIAEALARGEFEHLPGRGKPLPRDDLELLSPELRMAYRVLKNAGVVPGEVTLRKELADVDTLLRTLPPGPARDRAAQQRSVLLTKLSLERGRRLDGACVSGSKVRPGRRR